MTGRTTMGALALGLAYAVLRYVALGPIPAREIPLFVANKAIALASLALIALGFVAGPLGRRSPRLAALDPRGLGKAGLALAALHVVLSVVLLDATHFPKLFVDGRYSFLGGACLLAGGGALVVLLVMDRVEDHARLTPLARLVLVLGALHVTALGWPGWLVPGEWFGGLPPITLLAAVLAVLALLVRRREPPA